MLKKSLLLLTTTAILWPMDAAMAGDHKPPRARTEHARPAQNHAQNHAQHHAQPQHSQPRRGQERQAQPRFHVQQRTAPTANARASRQAEILRRNGGGERAFTPPRANRTVPSATYTPPARTAAKPAVKSRPQHTTGGMRRIDPPRTASVPSYVDRVNRSYTRGTTERDRLRSNEDLARFGGSHTSRFHGRDGDLQDRHRRDSGDARRDDRRRDRRHVQDRDRDRDHDRRDRRDRRDYRDYRADHHRYDHYRVWYHDRHRRIYRGAYWAGYYDSLWWNSYYRSYIYYRPYYFDNWPYYSGYWPVYARWTWYAPHHHYHYGGWCPGASFEYTVRYSSDPYAYAPADANNIVGTILGGVVGGIIGGEIDGSRHHRAGTIIGALVGAAIGNAATQPDASRRYDSSSTYRYEPPSDPGAYDYGKENYVPPAETKRSCLEYKMQNGAYTCTKWAVDFGDGKEGDQPQQ